ncbi:hypothetical protein [Cereibacter changlensis]|uniref:hypothetical protein n=1 Tax=Cereibacter changlensis TaxID=402884 RepID=UPI0011B1C899|nr:hypothetical protein [Cereibacter changlensis]
MIAANALNQNDSASRSIAEYLQAARWKHVLFTTYALSLSYFESEVLRVLLQQGCNDIWLVCDAQGYRSSLLERYSMRVGQEYRIVPIGLRRGVFHPKCIHLISEDEQLLLIGSGNVTFGGHGRNTEVFEALVPGQHATAFSDFSDFLEALGSQPDIKIARRDWIDDFARRAAQAAAEGADQSAQPVRLIHPLERTAIQQVGEVAAAIGPCRTVKIISPYHDPDGEAVRALLEAVNADSGAVAVTCEGTSPFPFSGAAGWSRPVVPKRPKIEGKRFVHAKWLQFDFGNESLILSGSFNATRKSIGTTDNVELGVLRRVAVPDQILEWQDCAAPNFAPAERMPSGLGQAEIVYASFDRHNPQKLTGQMISLQEVSGAWAFRIIQADGTTHSGETTLKDDGMFTVLQRELELLGEMPALQIVLQRDEREARGWVHNEMLLSVGARRRLTVGALSRLMRREGSDDDIQALLDYLSVAADKHLRVFSLPVLKNGEHDDPAEGTNTAEPVHVSLEDLAPMEELPEGAAGIVSAGLGSGDPFETALVRLRRMLLGHGSLKNAPSRDGLSLSILAEDEEDEVQRHTAEQFAYSRGLQDFENAIETMIGEIAEDPERLPGLLTIQFEIGMWMRIHRLKDIDGAVEFIESWLRRTAQRTTQPQDKAAALPQHFVTSSAIRAALITSGKRAEQLVGLHDNLEKFFGGAVDRELASALLIDDANTGFATALAQGQAALDLSAALAEVLSTRTRRQQLEDVWSARAAGEDVSSDLAVFQSPTGKALHESLLRQGWEKRVKRAIPHCEACSHCFLTYPLFEKSVFKRERIGRCIHCKKFSLDLTK